MSTISVIIPMFNSAPTARATLDSLLAQTEPSWEAVIVDDGSTDGCTAIAAEYAARDPRFRLIRRVNGGPASARNTGLDAARGEYIAFLDPDDLLYPRAYETLLQLAASNPHRAALGGWDHCDAAGKPLAWTESAAKYANFGLDPLLGLECFAIHAQLIHRDSLAGLRFDETLPFNEDTDLFLRLAIRGVEWTTTERVVCTYRLKAIDRGTARFACRFKHNIRVIRDGFGRARAAGWAASAAGRNADTSEAREANLLHSHALRYANLTIIQDPSPRKELAAEVFASVRSEDPITPDLAALAVRDFQFVDCLSAEQLERKIERYIPALAAWWDRCVTEGWAGPGFIAEAQRALAREVASMQDLASAVVDRCDGKRPIVLLGLGRNGVRIAQELHRRGRPVVVRDDGIDAAKAVARLAPVSITFLDREIPLDLSAQYIMSVLDDAHFLARLPATLRIVCWADVLKQRSERILARVLNAWPVADSDSGQPPNRRAA